MQNYRIHFEPQDRTCVVAVLRKYNDVIIDNISENSVGITIECDDPQILYDDLIHEIDQTIFELRDTRSVNSVSSL